MKLVLVTMVSLWSLCGCSGIGYIVGSGIDNSAHDFDTLTTCATLESGDEITLVQKDGHRDTGAVVEACRHLTFEQKVERISGRSSRGFDISTGSFSNSVQSVTPGNMSITLRRPGQDDVEVTEYSIDHVVVPHKKNAAFTGLVLGAAADVAAILIAASIFKQMRFDFSRH